MQSSNDNRSPRTSATNRSHAGHVRNLVRGSSKAFSLRVIGAAAAIVSQIVIARQIGQREFGEYSFALAVVKVLALVARIGLGTALLRFVGQYLAQGRPGLLTGISLFSFCTVTLVAGMLSLAVIGVCSIWGSHFSPGNIRALVAAAWLLPPLALTGIAQALLLGLKRIGPAVFSDQILRPLLVVAALLTLAGISGRSPGATDAVGAETIAVVVVVLISTIIIVRTVRGRIGWHAPRFDTRDWLTVSLPLLLMTGLQVLFNQTDIIMLGSLTTGAETGIYAAAARVARLVLFGLTAINAVAAPMIAEAFHAGRIMELRGVLNFVSRILLAFTVGVALLLVLAGREILGFFGPGFVSAWVPMVVLIAGQAVNSLSGPVAYLMTMTGNQNQAAKIVVLCSLLNILLNALFIPWWGIVGAAVATAASISAWNIWMLVSVRKTLDLNPSVFRRWGS